MNLEDLFQQHGLKLEFYVRDYEEVKCLREILDIEEGTPWYFLLEKKDPWPCYIHVRKYEYSMDFTWARSTCIDQGYKPVQVDLDTLPVTIEQIKREIYENI